MRFATLIVVLGLFGAACDETASAPAPAPAPAPDPDAPTILSGEIAADMTLTADVSYLLRGAVFVADGATLTIEAGTTIYGEGATNGALVVARGGRLVADGAPDAPIVFTSDQEVGFRARGDWGGLIINGRAPLNIPGNEAEGEGGTGAYGGDDPADDSGVLRYVRVEFAGSELSPDNELNGVAFQGVGSGTVVDSVQVHLSKDDGVEFFGGTVDARRVVCTGIGDDSFDWTEGWTGRGQFWIARQRGDDADQGIEADSNAENNDLLPYANPTLYNVTLIGDPGTETGDESDVGVLLREGTAGDLGNFIVMGFKEVGLDVDDAVTYGHAEGGLLTLRNSIFWENGGGNFDDDGSEDPPPAFGTMDFIMAQRDIREADPMLDRPYYLPGEDALAVCPVESSPALIGAAMPPNDGFFEPVNFIGACDVGDEWWTGWTSFASN